MSRIKEAQKILKALGLPEAQQNEMSALTLLALCGLKKNGKWTGITRRSMGVSKDIMAFTAAYYKKEYAPNTRETFRRYVLHQFVQAHIVDYNPDAPDLPVNSPKAHYALSTEAFDVLSAYGTDNWEKALEKFVNSTGKLETTYSKRRNSKMLTTSIGSVKLKLSPGRHNQIQIAVIEKFVPLYAKDSQVLYFGDTAKKNLYIKQDELKQIGIPIDKHSKLPDIVLYDAEKAWLYLIEVVTSHGPVTPKRIVELEKFLSNCTAGKIYITAFPDRAVFKKYFDDIAWETEVWIADKPDHLIHFNGDKFLGPR